MLSIRQENFISHTHTHTLEQIMKHELHVVLLLRIAASRYTSVPNVELSYKWITLT